MEASRALNQNEGFASEAARRKRLGQYFTGTKLGRLLAALAGADEAATIIDPMAGNGDMLVACQQYGAEAALFGAIEIDPIALNACKERIPKSAPILGSAFASDSLSQLVRDQWELVITNPPYVRYQSLTNGAGEDFPIPSGDEIRADLLIAIENAAALDAEDKRLFAHLASAYSGLADLAVPSWMLCATLCAPGGRLALVLPESWLSREYASIVQYLLLRWFKIKYIVEDTHAVWFPAAQVKTTLLIADRIERKNSAFDWRESDKFLRIRLSSSAMGPNGIVDNIFNELAINPEKSFAKLAEEWLALGTGESTSMMHIEHVPLSVVANNLRRACSKKKWLSKLESQEKIPRETSIEAFAMPNALGQWLGPQTHADITSLQAFGVNVGQGLRTGANFFFYADAINESADKEELRTNKQLGSSVIQVPKTILLPVLRKQSELPSGFVVEASSLKGRVLALQNVALPEDILSAGMYAALAYAGIPEQLADFIRAADELEVDEAGRRIRQLSAVAPNIRAGGSKKVPAPRFWYMLPDFAPRHRPDLFVARVNSGAPRTFLNADREAIVDANFSTIWLDSNAIADKWGLLALLNSTWCSAALELSAAVMGGGALKVEASHLLRVPVPRFKQAEWEVLSSLGRELVSQSDATLCSSIDELVCSALLGRPVTNEEYYQLSMIALDARQRRERRKKKELVATIE
jgi:hypothetical protein